MSADSLDSILSRPGMLERLDAEFRAPAPQPFPAVASRREAWLGDNAMRAPMTDFSRSGGGGGWLNKEPSE